MIGLEALAAIFCFGSDGKGPTVSLPYYTRIKANELGLKSVSLLPEFCYLADRTRDVVKASVLARHCLFILTILASSCLGFYRRDSVLTLAAVTGVLYLCPFILIDITPDWRYLLSVYIIALGCGIRMLEMSVRLDRTYTPASDEHQ